MAKSKNRSIQVEDSMSRAAEQSDRTDEDSTSETEEEEGADGEE
jgi:hypothetical protein